MKSFYWEKLGLIADSYPKKEWSQQYLQFPAALVMEDRLRIFFTTRPQPEPDGKNVTYIRYVDLDSIHSRKILGFAEEPVIPLGGPGTFDQFGTMPGDFVRFDDKVMMFYTGWSRLQSVPYNFSIGLAISQDGGRTFQKYSEGPVMGASAVNPFTVGSGAVLYKDGTFHAYYIAGIAWKPVKGKLEHTYTIKHATSTDGINWDTSAGIAIERHDEFEALAAPTIIELDGRYHMWFSYRGSFDFRGGDDSYKMGYAYSDDLYTWHRDDAKAGIELSEEGWDSKMMCYPYVLQIEGDYYMFYNGNYFGIESLGVAKLHIRE